MIFFAMLIALLGGIAIGLTWGNDHDDNLPAGHPLSVLPGTRIIDQGEFQ